MPLPPGMNRARGVLIFCGPDFEPLLESPEGMAITPLLLGREWNGLRHSIIRHMSTVLDRVVADYIYHLEDLSTGSITADWETAACEPFCIETRFPLFIKYKKNALLMRNIRQGISTCFTQNPRCFTKHRGFFVFQYENIR